MKKNIFKINNKGVSELGDLYLIMFGGMASLPFVFIVGEMISTHIDNKELHQKIETIIADESVLNSTSVISFDNGYKDIINSYNVNNETVYVGLMSHFQYQDIQENDNVKMEPITAFFTEEDYQKYKDGTFTEEDFYTVIDRIKAEENGEVLSLTNN